MGLSSGNWAGTPRSEYLKQDPATGHMWAGCLAHGCWTVAGGEPCRPLTHGPQQGPLLSLDQGQRPVRVTVANKEEPQRFPRRVVRLPRRLLVLDWASARYLVPQGHAGVTVSRSRHSGDLVFLLSYSLTLIPTSLCHLAGLLGRKVTKGRVSEESKPSSRTQSLLESV